MNKAALLIGVSEYNSESGLKPLPSAAEDVQAMQRVLLQASEFTAENITVLTNPQKHDVEEAIYKLFADRQKEDLLLFYFSGHGIKDETGRLYFSLPTTRKNKNGSLIKHTAVPATLLHESMNDSRSTCQALVLDCCFSGAFAKGLTIKDDGSIDIYTQLGGKGRAIFTSSNSTEYSFQYEGFKLSVYTHFFVEGLETGAADLDSDGLISADEMHIYISDKVKQTAPAMNPQFFPVQQGHKIYLGRSLRLQGNPELKYRKEVEERLHKGDLTPTAKKLLNHKRNNLGLSTEQAEVIEAEVKKSWQEQQRKLQEYEETLLEELKRYKPLPPQTLTELNNYLQELGLHPEDVESIHQNLDASIVPPKPVFEPVATESSPVAEPLPITVYSSKTDIDYAELRALLTASDWKAADKVTNKLMLTATSREKQKYLDISAIENFPCEDLCIIDDLWVSYSQGKWGFSVQKQIWQECVSSIGYNGGAENFDAWEKFCIRIGWCKKGTGWFGSNTWLNYQKLTFDLEKSLRGELPGLAVQWWDACLGFRVIEYNSLLSRKDLFYTDCQVERSLRRLQP